MKQKRPSTDEQKRSHEQNVGRIPRQTVSRPEPPPSSRVQKKKPKDELGRNEKRLRSLNKLLREIETLQQQESNGEALDEQQLAKLDRLDDVIAEMESLMGG